MSCVDEDADIVLVDGFLVDELELLIVSLERGAFGFSVVATLGLVLLA